MVPWLRVLLPSLIKFTKQPALPLALLLLLLLALLLMASHRYYLRLPFYCDGSYSLLLVIASHCSLASYRSAPSPFLSIPTNKDSSFKTIRCSAKPEYFQSDRPARTHDSATCSCLMTCLPSRWGCLPHWLALLSKWGELASGPIVYNQGGGRKT